MKQLKRLQEIQENLMKHPNALALIALGSIGVELERLDHYSDLDFFIIVKDATHQGFLDDPSWLEVTTSKLGFLFRNTKDGFKFMYEDGIYGEQAVFQLKEVPYIVGSNGRIAWQKESIDLNVNFGDTFLHQRSEKPTIDFYINEALTNIYVGYTRYLRGEKLAAHALIQHHAFANILKAIESEFLPAHEFVDLFDSFRRVEVNYPQFTSELSSMLVSLDELPIGIEAMIQFLEKHWTLNQTLLGQIRKLMVRVN